MKARNRQLAYAVAAAICLGSLVSAWLVYKEVQQELATSLAVVRATKLRLATANYYVAYEHFPPSSVESAPRQEVSWRCLLAAQRLYSSKVLPINLADALNKVALEGEGKPYYTIGTMESADGNQVSDFVAVADRSAILAAGDITIREVTDGDMNTILFAQCRGVAFDWKGCETIDIADFAANGRFGTDAGEGFPGQLLVFADLAIYRVKRSLPDGLLCALWTYDQGDGVDREQLEEEGYIVRVSPWSAASL